MNKKAAQKTDEADETARDEHRGEQPRGDKKVDPNELDRGVGVPNGSDDPADDRNDDPADLLEEHAGDAVSPPNGGAVPSDDELTDRFGGGVDEEDVQDLLTPDYGVDQSLTDGLEQNGGPIHNWDDVDGAPGGVEPNVEHSDSSPLTEEGYAEGSERLTDLVIKLGELAQEDGEWSQEERESFNEARTALDNFEKKHNPDNVWVLERGGDQKTNLRDDNKTGEGFVDFATPPIKGEEIYRNYATGDLSDKENLPDGAHTVDGRSTIEDQEGTRKPDPEFWSNVGDVLSRDDKADTSGDASTTGGADPSVELGSSDMEAEEEERRRLEQQERDEERTGNRDSGGDGMPYYDQGYESASEAGRRGANGGYGNDSYSEQDQHSETSEDQDDNSLEHDPDGEPTGEENAATAEWLRGQGLGELVDKVDYGTSGAIDPGTGESDVDDTGGNEIDDADGVSNPGGADGGSGPKGGGKKPGPGHANGPDYGPDDDRTYEGETRNPADEVVGVSHDTLDGDFTDDDPMVLDPADLQQGPPTVVGYDDPQRDDASDEADDANDEPVKGDVEERTKSRPEQLENDAEHLADGEAELQSIAGKGEESQGYDQGATVSNGKTDPADARSGDGSEDFLRENAGDEAGQRPIGDDGLGGATTSGPTDDQISEEFGEHQSAETGLGRDPDADQERVDELLDPDVPTSGDGSEWDSGLKGFEDGPVDTSAGAAPGPSMNDISSGSGSRGLDRWEANQKYEQSDKTPDDYQDLQSEHAAIDEEYPVQTAIDESRGSNQGAPAMPDPPPAKPPAATPPSPQDQTDLNDWISTTGGEIFHKGEHGGLDRPFDDQTAAPNTTDAQIIDDQSQQSKETVTVVDDTGESSEVPVNHQSSDGLGRVTYGHDEDGQFWAIDENNNAYPIDREDIPDGRAIKDLDGVFVEDDTNDSSTDKTESDETDSDETDSDETDTDTTDNDTTQDGSEKERGADDAGQPDPENYEDAEIVRAREQQEAIRRRVGDDDDVDVFDRTSGAGNDVDPNEHDAVDDSGGNEVDNADGISNPGGADGGSGPKGDGKKPGPGQRNEPDYGPDGDQTYEGRERSPGEEVVGVSHGTLDGDFTDDDAMSLDPETIHTGPPQVVEDWTSSDADPPRVVEDGDIDPHQFDDAEETDYVGGAGKTEGVKVDGGGKETSTAEAPLPPVNPKVKEPADDPAEGVDNGEFVWVDETTPTEKSAVDGTPRADDHQDVPEAARQPDKNAEPEQSESEKAESEKAATSEKVVEDKAIDVDYGKPAPKESPDELGKGDAVVDVADTKADEPSDKLLADMSAKADLGAPPDPMEEPETFVQVVEVADVGVVDDSVEELLTD